MTKLSIPSSTKWHLPRPHLDTLLREGLSKRLTTLIAAAGHGKTSTLAHFVQRAETPRLWIQLDAADSDLARFTQYLAHGITHDLKGGNLLGSSLAEGIPSSSGLDRILQLAVADLSMVNDHAILVLDDLHFINKDSPVIKLVQQLVQYSSTNIHFYICSRSSLPFSTARLKVIQEANELTETDLRFTPAEIRSFIHHMAHVDLTEEQLDQVSELTEGWSAALVLLASSLLRSGSLNDFLQERLPADLFAYLTDELFRTLPPRLQRFMEETSILDTCSISACEGILGINDARDLIEHVLSSHTLVTPLGPDTFRYHHLLQRFLQERLRNRDGGTSFRQLHLRTGDWYKSIDQHEEAVKYYLRGGWTTEAGNLIENLAPVWMRSSRLERLRGLLTHLPAETRETYPWITLCEARLAYDSGNPDAGLGLARLAQRVFAEQENHRGIVQAQTLMGEIFINRQDFESAEEAYQSASEALRPDYHYEEGILLQRRAVLSYMRKGASEDVENDLRRALSLAVETGDRSGEAWVCNLLGMTRASLGDFTSAIKLLERSREIFLSLGEPSHDLGTNLAWVYLTVGRFRDALRISEPMFTSATRKINRVYAGCYLIHCYSRLGEFGKAMSVAQAVNALVEELGHKEQRSNMAAELSASYRLSGQPQMSVPYANEAMRLAKQIDRANFFVTPLKEAMLLHLFHTGNLSAVLRMGQRVLVRLNSSDSNPRERMIVRIMLAVAEFRNSRTESRPEAVSLLQEGLAECSRRGYHFFALQEWQLALCVVIYGLVYEVHSELCAELVRLLNTRLPDNVLHSGIPLQESESKLLPAAWQALPDEESRIAFSSLLTATDRRRIVNLAVGPSPVSIQCLGALSVTVGTQTIDIKALKKRKSGLLLTFLLCQTDPVPREQLMERLWPDLDPDAADTSLRVSLHHLRRLLEPHLGGRSKSRYVQAEGGLVWFSRQPEVQIDLDHFRLALSAAADAMAANDSATAASHYEVAARTYRGDLSTDDPYSAALEDVRNQLRQRFADALDWLGNYYFQNQNTAKAILTFKQRLTLDPAYEPAHQALIRAYLETGQVAAARQQYASCKEALSTELGVQPSRTTESLLQLAISMERESTVAIEPERKPAKKK